MPIYEYECRACGESTEVIQKFSDAPLTDCPACGAAALTKLVSAAAFRLSGGGWYETDFKKDKQRNLKEGAKEAAKEGAKPGTEKAKPAAAEAKPAASSPASTKTGTTTAKAS